MCLISLHYLGFYRKGWNLEIKCCTSCEQPFPNTRAFFYKNPGQKDRLTTRCKPCLKAQQASFKRRYPLPGEYLYAVKYPNL